jgi:hypothetical protein
MSNCKKVQLNLSIAKHELEQLRKMAAMEILNDPSIISSAAGIASKAVSQFIMSINNELKSKKENENGLT